MKTSNIIEREELLDILKKNGFEKIVDILYEENSDIYKVYTKKGKLNKSGACRALNCKPKELEETLEKIKRLLGDDWNSEI